jgi:hypothetical protein
LLIDIGAVLSAGELPPPRDRSVVTRKPRLPILSGCRISAEILYLIAFGTWWCWLIFVNRTTRQEIALALFTCVVGSTILALVNWRRPPALYWWATAAIELCVGIAFNMNEISAYAVTFYALATYLALRVLVGFALITGASRIILDYVRRRRAA